MHISPARVAAFEVLIRIERDRAFSSILLPQYEERLSDRDAALCHQIVLGVLRRKLFLDETLRAFSGPKKLDLEVLVSLRMGAFQLLELDRIPAHSAVNESVALVQRAKKASAKGLVNAVLRKISTGNSGHDLSQDSHSLSLETSHPQWLLDRWAAQFGAEHAASIARANNVPPRLSFRRSGIAKAELPENVLASNLVGGAFIAERLSPELRQIAERGEIYFQDEASQMVAGQVSIPAGGRFLDACAAPGGKTTQIALRYRKNNVAIVAGDLHWKRVETLRANCARQGAGSVRVVQYDASGSLPFAEESFDVVLVDAPCSGTGTIASNPEIRYLLQPRDIEELSRKQLSILRNASKVLKADGRLYYSTCSLEREENEDVVNAFLDGAPEFVLRGNEVDARFRTEAGFGRTFPDRDGTDGFFFAPLVRDRSPV